MHACSGGRTIAMVNPPARIGKPRIAGKARRQTKMEDFKFISGACPGAEQQCREPMRATSSAVSDIRHDMRQSSESDLTAAITEQLIIQQDEVPARFSSPASWSFASWSNAESFMPLSTSTHVCTKMMSCNATAQRCACCLSVQY